MSLDIDITEVECMSGEIYRRSQYEDLETARECGAVYDIGLHDGGYSAIIDSLLALRKVADCLCHESDKEDVRIVMLLNEQRPYRVGEKYIDLLPECWLSEATTVIDDWLATRAAGRRLAPNN
jgi:hypothetical protein